MSTACFILASTDVGTAGIALHCALLLLLVVLSGTFSGSETVLFSLTRVQLEHHSKSHNPFRRSVAVLMRHPKRTLMTILVGNTAVNVLLFAVSYVFFRGLGGQFGAWVTPAAAVGSVLLLVVGGEVIPKVLAVTFADRLAPFSATIVRTVGTVAGPLGRVIDVLLAEPFVRVVLGGTKRRAAGGRDLSTAELKALLQLSRRRGEIDWMEDVFLREVIDLGSTRVHEVMVPRVEVVAYDINGPAEGLRELMRSTRLKKIPVYDGTMDNVVGLIYAKMLFLNPEQPLSDVLMPVRFVPELATCEHLLQHFRRTKSQLAIVVDEHGGVAGLVTLEDVLEEIVGEIYDEYEEELELVHIVGDNDVRVDGKVRIDELNEILKSAITEEEDYDTLAGYLYNLLGKVPSEGDEYEADGLRFRIEKVTGQRIERVIISAEGIGRAARESVEQERG